MTILNICPSIFYYYDMEVILLLDDKIFYLYIYLFVKNYSELVFQLGFGTKAGFKVYSIILLSFMYA